jgi:hypothetical protein
MWRGWDGPSRFLAGGALFAAVLVGWHIIATLMG